MIRVTEALAAVGLIDTSFLTEHGCDRGTAVHEAIALDIRGDLDDTDLHPEVRPFVESWRGFWRENGLVPLESEAVLRDEVLDYCGHPDLIARTKAHPRIVIDFKGGARAAWHPLQTAGYALLDATTTGGTTPARGALYLNREGRAASFVPHPKRSDLEYFKAALSLAHFLKGNR